MKCLICNKEVKDYKGLSSHLRQTHKIKSREYYDTYLKQENDGTCLTCNNKTIFQNIKNGYAKFCSSKCAHNNQDVLYKISCTCTERYGGLGTSSKILQEKIINTTIKNHGVKNVYMREDLRQKSHSKESKLKDYKTKKKNNTFNTSKIVIAFNFLEIIESFFPRTPRVKNAVGTCIQASNTQPSPRLYAIPGPPINELAPT